MYVPDFTLMMMNEESYSILLVTMKEAERVAEDIPLCPLQTVIENLEKEIESGTYIGHPTLLKLLIAWVIIGKPFIFAHKRI